MGSQGESVFKEAPVQNVSGVPPPQTSCALSAGTTGWPERSPEGKNVLTLTGSNVMPILRTKVRTQVLVTAQA